MNRSFLCRTAQTGVAADGRGERDAGRAPVVRRGVGKFLLLAFLAMFPCWADAADYKTVDAKTLHAWMQSGEVTLVNVMSRIECLDHRIPGSLCLACEEAKDKLASLPRGRKIVMYCETEGCTRSCQAASEAVAQGIGDVYVLEGGMPAWKRAGYPMESVQRVPRVPVKAVKADELKGWQGRNPDHQILDIRDEASFGKGHLPGAVNIPFYRLHERYQELPQDRVILVVDGRGFRSFLAASYLARKGHRVVRLFGGMSKWHDYMSGKRQVR